MIEKTSYKVIKPKGDVLKKEPSKAMEVIVNIIETETKTREVNLASLDQAIDMMQNAIIKGKEEIVSLEKDIERFKVEREKVKQELEKSLGVIIKNEVKNENIKK